MSRRYIELYSANRNRNQYPLPSSFEVPFAPTRQLNNYQAVDPICSGPIYYIWNGGDPTNPAPFPSPSTIVADSNSSPGCIYLKDTANSLSTYLSSIPNYYVGYYLTTSSSESKTIIAYDPTAAKFLLDQPFNDPNYKDGTTSYTITDPSNGSSATPTIHIPSRDLCGNSIKAYSDAYDSCYIVDESKSSKTNIVYSQIISYNFITQLATLDRPLSGWSSSDSYSIRKTLPQEKYTLTSNPVPNTESFIFSLNGQIVCSDYYSGLNPNPNPNPIVVPGMVVSLDIGEGSRELNYYAGKYIYNTSNCPSSTDLQFNGGGIYGLYYIKSSAYNSTTNRVELLIDQTSIPEFNNCFSSNTIYVKDPITPFLKNGDIINIVTYIRDNYSPLNYNGTIASSQETVCYEISLISLILPNTVLRTGARVAFYPFVYVEFTNTTSPSGSSNSIIYSNSPNSNRALFIAPITDTNQPLNSSFVKIYSNMTQTVKFKPNDSLKFSVYLPDGKLFETVEQDYLSPYPPNGIIQIDAVFGIRRI